MKDFVEIFSALLTPLIAIVVAYIAWQQYRVQRKMFNRQMYERRYVVFKAYMSFLVDIMRDGKLSYQRLGQFYAEASEANFLFADVIPNKREELYRRGLELAYAHERLYPDDGSPGLPVGEERTKVAKETGEHLMWFNAQVLEVRKLFQAEMGI